MDSINFEDERIRCETCKYFHLLKEFKSKLDCTKEEGFHNKNYWKYGCVCTLLPQTEKGFDSFAIVVDKDDKCESWTPTME